MYTGQRFLVQLLSLTSRGCPGVPVHGGIPIVFTSIHGVVTQFVNVSFLCVPVHEDQHLNVDVLHNNNALKELNDCIGGLLHLELNVITFRTKCYYI